MAIKHNLDLFGKIMKISSVRDRLILLLIIELGLKSNEISNLKFSFFEFKKDSYEITFIKANQKISLSKKLSRTLLNYLSLDQNIETRDYHKYFSSDEYIFLTRQNTRISERRIQQILKKYGFDNSAKIRKELMLSELKKSTTKIDDIKERFNIKFIREKKYISEKDIQKLISVNVRNREFLIAVLILETGITLQQISNLKKENLSGNNLIVEKLDTRFKSQKISKKISVPLKKLLIENSGIDFLFESKNGTKLSERRIEQLLAELSNKVGFKLTPQILRNTHLINLVSFNRVFRLSFRVDDPLTYLFDFKEVSEKHYGTDNSVLRVYEGYYTSLDNKLDNNIEAL